MISKEEIEKAKEYIQQFIGIKKEYKHKPIKVKTLINTRQAIEILLQYIDQLEQENNKQNKIIDEMAKSWKQDDYRSVEEIKQYFEEKVEEK